MERLLFEDWRFIVAARYTRSGTGDRLTSFTSLISGLGLVLGVAILIIVLSVMNGFERELEKRVLGILPHGVIYLPDASMDPQKTMQHILSHPDVIAVAPIFEETGLLLANGDMAGVAITGIDPEAEKKVSILDQFFVAGSMDRLGVDRFSMVLGRRLATQLSTGVGDTVTFVLPDIRISLVGPLPVTRQFTVSGIFESGTDADKTQVYVAIDDLRRIQKRHGLEGFRLLTSDLFASQDTIRELITTGRHELFGESWRSRHGNLYGAILMQKKTMLLMLMLLVAVAAFNVVSNLLMVVKEKTGDIAILRTVGASSNAVRLIFILHGLLVGAAGIILGLVVGTLMSLVISDIVSSVDDVLGLGLMDEYFIQYLPVDIRLGDMILVASVSFLICLAATVYPAGKAAQAHPVEALQYES